MTLRAESHARVAQFRRMTEHRFGASAYYSIGFDARGTPGTSGWFMSALEPTGKGVNP